MVNPCKIAVVGAGISGLAAAAFLKVQGHDVTIFEKFPAARPIGSGLLLQITGLAVLANLGLDAAAIGTGAKINRFVGQTLDGKTVFDLSHENLHPHYFSLGIHRHSIFQLLHQKAAALGIPFVTGAEIVEAREENHRYTLLSPKGQEYPGFDIIIDASGAHSALRRKHAAIKSTKPFAYGALWGVCEDTGEKDRHTLEQRFHRAKTSIGLIPIGKASGGGKDQVAFHWSIRNADYNSWKSRPFAQWQDEIGDQWALAGKLATQFKGHGDLAWAAYSDVALKRFYTGRIVFIGDACHSISPRLGQGANLGLVDALVLARSLEKNAHLEIALAHYGSERKSQVKFYHSASRWLTLFFQSDSRLAPALRDIGLGHLCKIPYMHSEMLKTLGGMKAGLLGTLDPGLLHESYSFRR